MVEFCGVHGYCTVHAVHTVHTVHTVQSYINNTLYGMSTAVMIQAIWTSTLAEVCLQCMAKYEYISIYLYPAVVNTVYP